VILLCYRKGTGLELGLKHNGLVFSVPRAAHVGGLVSVPTTPAAMYAAGLDALTPLRRLEKLLPRLGALGVPEGALTLAPVVPHPQKLILIGLNYRGHAAETNATIPEQPVLFSKFNNALAGSGEKVPLPRNAVRYDYEAELAVVIGRRARMVPPDQALSCVMGYCCANDLSCRDLQFLSSQWLLGKTLDKFMPLGPYLVTADHVPDPQALGVRSFVNGAIRQNSTTADMIFSVAELISYVSRYMTLEPGDVISTGTPQGVILGMKEERVWLKAGDEVVVEVDGLGRLVSRLVEEEPV